MLRSTLASGVRLKKHTIRQKNYCQTTDPKLKKNSFTSFSLFITQRNQFMSVYFFHSVLLQVFSAMSKPLTIFVFLDLSYQLPSLPLPLRRMIIFSWLAILNSCENKNFHRNFHAGGLKYANL